MHWEIFFSVICSSSSHHKHDNKVSPHLSWHEQTLLPAHTLPLTCSLRPDSAVTTLTSWQQPPVNSGVSRAAVHVHLGHPIALHWTTAFDLTSYATLQIKSADTSFLTLFYIIVSFQWFLWSEVDLRNWGRDSDGSRTYFFFFPFWMFSCLLLTYFKHFPCRR